MLENLTEKFNEFRDSLSTRVLNMEKKLQNFDNQIDSYRTEVLWRIQNAEELIKSRISEHKVNDLLDTLRKNLVQLSDRSET